MCLWLVSGRKGKGEMRAASRLRLWQQTEENRDSWDCCLEISGILTETHTFHLLCIDYQPHWLLWYNVYAKDSIYIQMDLSVIFLMRKYCMSFNVLSGQRVLVELPEKVYCFQMLPEDILCHVILANRVMYH